MTALIQRGRIDPFAIARLNVNSRRWRPVRSPDLFAEPYLTDVYGSIYDAVWIEVETSLDAIMTAPTNR